MAVSPFLSPERSPLRWVLSGLAVLAVVVGIAVVVRQPGPGTAPAADRSPSASAGTPRPAVLPTPTAVPGLDAAAEEKLLDRCLRKEQREDASDARVYNVVVTGKATAALIYATHWKIGCFIGQPSVQSLDDLSLSVGINSEWMTGPVAIDIRDGGNAADGRPGYDIVGGRLAPEVAKVRVELRGKTVEVPVVNHTYLVRFERSQDYAESDRENDPRFVVHAFDASGAKIATFDGTSAPDCTYDHRGERLEVSENPPVRPCVSASPWVV